jgi:hypothetical protein
VGFGQGRRMGPARTLTDAGRSGSDEVLQGVRTAPSPLSSLSSPLSFFRLFFARVRAARSLGQVPSNRAAAYRYLILWGL